MRRFYVPAPECEGNDFFLTGREAHHALHVLRVRQGESVTVLDGVGHELACEVLEKERDRLRLEVKERRSLPPPPCQVTLAQAIPKGRTFETVIQKATELGAFRIVPLLTERVEVHISGKDAERKLEKWRLTANEAIKQCGSAWLPAIEAPITPGQLLAQQNPFDLALVASLQSDARHPREYFNRFQATGRKPHSVCLWIGPEGDFLPAEMDTIKAGGALPMTLGPLVLRTDTATVYCLSVIGYELGK